MIVDTTMGMQLKINVDITFHALPCSEAHLDAMDIAGDNQLNIEHEMMKQRLSAQGKALGNPGIEIIGSKVISSGYIVHNECGSCYGAETPIRKCCDTCNDVKDAYKEKGWNFGAVIVNATQCIHDSSHPFTGVGKDEGCRITGSMNVNKVAGNFHIAHGESIVRDGRHIHQFNPEDAPKYNCSHTIHSISFGETYPNMPKNPLDTIKKVVSKDVGTGLYQYFIKVIPTIYTDESSRRLYTNQYTFTERFRPLLIPDTKNAAPIQTTILPGIFFVYDLSPFLIEVKRTRMPFLHLMKQLFAIVGGIFGILKIIDLLIFKIDKYILNKRSA